jgi:cytochrome c oxidase cbb3-type subunit 2
MNQGPVILFCCLLTFACSWYGIVFKSQVTMGRAEPVKSVEGPMYPVDRAGLAREGLEVYRSLGCGYCHTQQVRDKAEASDFARGWGKRHTVSQDSIYDRTVLSGVLRWGPDLANIGARNPSEQYHLLHLYNPKLTVKESIMPPYRFLFEKRKVVGQPSADALPLSGPEAPAAGFEIVPKREARALVAYLQSLQSEAGLFEAPVPPPPTNAAPATATNAPAGGTNAAPGTNAVSR